MSKFCARSLVAVTAATGILLAGIPAAYAAPVTETHQQNVVDLSQVEPTQGSIAEKVKAAESLEEAIGILESNGFREVVGAGADESELRFEKTVAGITVGFELPTSSGIQPMWAAGWNWGKGGPYVKGTVAQWQDALNMTGIARVAACALITATLGAAGCATVVGWALYYINKNFSKPWPKNACIAVNGSAKAWVEAC